MMNCEKRNIESPVAVEEEQQYESSSGSSQHGGAVTTLLPLPPPSPPLPLPLPLPQSDSSDQKEGRVWIELLGASRMLSATSDAALMHRFSCMAVRDILELFLARAFRQQGHADSPRRMLGFMSGIVSTYRNRSFPAPEYIMEAMLLLARWDFGLGGPTILIETALAETERRVYNAVIQDDSSLCQTSLKSLCDLRKKRLNVYDKCMAACKECDGRVGWTMKNKPLFDVKRLFRSVFSGKRCVPLWLVMTPYWSSIVASGNQKC